MSALAGSTQRRSTTRFAQSSHCDRVEIFAPSERMVIEAALPELRDAELSTGDCRRVVLPAFQNRNEGLRRRCDEEVEVVGHEACCGEVCISSQCTLDGECKYPTGERRVLEVPLSVMGPERHGEILAGCCVDGRGKADRFPVAAHPGAGG